MKLVVFNSKKLGALLEDGSVVDLNSTYFALLASKGVNRPHAQGCSLVPPSLLAFIEEGEAGLRAAEEAVSFVRKGAREDPGGERLVLKPVEARLVAPLPSLASRIAMAGANFYDHAAKAYSMIRGVSITEEDIRRDVEEGRSPPWGFWKSPRNVVGHDEPIVYPARKERLDYEVEVAAIFGRRGKDIPEEEAMDHIYGYAIVNDISARDQPSDNGFFLAKNFYTSIPMGPCIVTADELGDPHGLGLRLKVNGETRQNGSQEDMIRGHPFWISWLSRDMTFYPGDIICGGTCAGTALDTSPSDSDGTIEPDRFLKPGDVVEAWVEKIGTLRNPVTARS